MYNWPTLLGPLPHLRNERLGFTSVPPGVRAAQEQCFTDTLCAHQPPGGLVNMHTPPQKVCTRLAILQRLQAQAPRALSIAALGASGKSVGGLELPQQ